MEDILYLTHRIPFPPNKGDKIRSFHILKHLAKTYRVHLGTFVDDDYDLRYLSELDAFVVDKQIIRLNPRLRKIASLRGLITGKPLSNVYYEKAELLAWVTEKIEKLSIRKAVLFSSPMAQFLNVKCNHTIFRVMDFVDVDSEKWLQYADKHPFPMNLLYRREGNKLRQFEHNIANQFEASLFVSDQEAELFETTMKQTNGRVHAMLNGVDTVFFDPNLTLLNPYSDGQKIIVFTGAMDYWANMEAVEWFAEDVLPFILAKQDDVLFYIVGARPGEKVKALASNANIRVTGSVEDIRPYVKHAHVAIAPLKVARGIQNKVLEAMAMKKFIVATPEAMEGISKSTSANVRTVGDRERFASEVLAGLASPTVPVDDSCREFVMNYFSWDSHLHKLTELLGQSTTNKGYAEITGSSEL